MKIICYTIIKVSLIYCTLLSSEFDPCVTLDHKTSLKWQFFLINNLSIDVWLVMIGQYLKIWNLRVQKNLNIEKIIFKVVQIKFLAMHITNQN